MVDMLEPDVQRYGFNKKLNPRNACRQKAEGPVAPVSRGGNALHRHAFLDCLEGLEGCEGRD